MALFHSAKRGGLISLILRIPPVAGPNRQQGVPAFRFPDGHKPAPVGHCTCMGYIGWIFCGLDSKTFM
jgi:hypothetical protein